jgi:hypothetical protein
MARRARTPARLAVALVATALALAATCQAAPAKAKAAAAPAAAPAPKCETECQNGGTCTLGQWSAHAYCVCPDGFAGGACELKGRVCSVERAERQQQQASASSSSDPRISLLADGGAPTAGATVFCQNGGTCAVTEVPASGGAAGGPMVKRPYCDCHTAPGFSGRFCHVRATRCNSEGPVRECLNGGTCPEGRAALRESATCACPPDFGGRNCELDYSGAAQAGADRDGRPKAAAGWSGPNGKTVGALTVEQELALMAQEGANVQGPTGGLATWQVVAIAVGSALGAAAVAGALLAVAVHRRRRAQDRLTREHNEKRRLRMRRGPRGSTSGGGGGGRKAPIDEEQPGSAGGAGAGAGGPGHHAAGAHDETPMASPLAAALRPPARAADQF